MPPGLDGFPDRSLPTSRPHSPQVPAMTKPHGRSQHPVRARPWVLALALAASATASSCSTLQQLVALRRVEFHLDGATDVHLAGVSVSDTESYTDLTLVDAARLANAIAAQEVPLDLRLSLSGENPADNPAEARLVRMAWTLFLDDRETVSGVLTDPVVFPPGTRQPFGVQVSLNLVEFFEGNLHQLVDLALGVAGRGGDGTEVALRVTPTVDTALGPIRYPEPITLLRTRVGG